MKSKLLTPGESFRFSDDESPAPKRGPDSPGAKFIPLSELEYIKLVVLPVEGDVRKESADEVSGSIVTGKMTCSTRKESPYG